MWMFARSQDFAQNKKNVVDVHHLRCDSETGVEIMESTLKIMMVAIENSSLVALPLEETRAAKHSPPGLFEITSCEK